MKYFKNKDNRVFVYADDVDESFLNEQIKAIGLTSISEAEYKELPYINLSQEQRLELAKRQKLSQIKLQKEALLSAGFEYQGKVYQSADTDLIRINGTLMNAILNPEAMKSVEWIALDDSKNAFTIDEFKAFAQAIAMNIQAVIFKANALKQSVRNAKSVQEVEKISWQEA